MVDDQLVRECGTSHQQQPARAVEPAVERRLHCTGQRTVIDAARRLVQDGSQWRPPVGAITGRRVVPPGPWSGEGGGDAVDQDDAAASSPQGVAGPARRHEFDACAMSTGRLGHPPVIQVAAGELVG